MPSIHRYAPRAIPADVADLMPRFGLTVRDLLTTDRQSAKLRHGMAIARAVILYHMPARALAAAITPDNDASGAACRSFIPSLLEIAEREGLTARALAWNGCPWATAGCGSAHGGGCLNWSGHGGMAGNGNAVQAARGRRTLAMISAPEVYGRAVFWAVLRHLRAARRDGLPLSVRLRGTDEGPAIGWHRLPLTLSSAESRSIADRYGVDAMPGTLTMAERLASVPDLHGYEYSKAPLDGPLGLLAQRQHCDITASFKADSAMACHDGLAALQNGFRLAVPVAVKRGDPLPVGLTLSHGGESISVSCVDGDRHDHRWLDEHGVAVTLRTKKSAGSVASVADLFSLQPHDRPQRLADGTVRLAWAD